MLRRGLVLDLSVAFGEFVSSDSGWKGCFTLVLLWGLYRCKIRNGLGIDQWEVFMD